MNTFSSERELIEHYDKVHKRLLSGNGHAKQTPPLPTYQIGDENALAGILKRLQGIEDRTEDIERGIDKLQRMVTLEQNVKCQDSYPHNPQLSFGTVEKVLEIVCDEEGVGREEVCSARRTKRITEARQIVCYLAHKWTVKTLNQIGHVLGNRDHTTIFHGINKITRLRPRDAGLNARIWRCEEKLELLQFEKKPVASLADSIDLSTANIGQKETA